MLVFYIKLFLILEAQQNNRIRKLFMKITSINKANENNSFAIINADGNSSDSGGGTSHAFTWYF